MKIDLGDGVVEIFDHVNGPELIQNISESAFLEGHAEDPFYVCNLGDVLRKHRLWQQKFPRIEPFYAIKCNPDKNVLKLLSSLKIGFDCASRSEIAQVLSFGVPPEQIIYANPCKQATHIQYASLSGVKFMTFDSASELIKIYKFAPMTHLVLRIFVGATKALCPLGLKFGANLDDVPELLILAQSLKLNIVGVSFHVGSGCFDESAYMTAIRQAHQVFQLASSMNINMTLLDIGGGFPGNLDKIHHIDFFNSVCDTINSSLDQYFPPESGVRIIAEPGRYYVSSAYNLAVTVISMRESISQFHEPLYHYYINEGVYGAFNCTVFDHYIGDHYLLNSTQDSEEDKLFSSTFWGPSCDSADKVLENIKIRKISVGERIVFENMGAYTMAAASTFNGFQNPYIRYYALLADFESLSELIGEIAYTDAIQVVEPAFPEIHPEEITTSKSFYG